MKKKKIFVFSFICSFIHSTDSTRAFLLSTLLSAGVCGRAGNGERQEMGAAGGAYHICTGQSDVYSYMDRNIYKQNVVQRKMLLNNSEKWGYFFSSDLEKKSSETIT